MTLGNQLLYPESVALVGASDDITKTTARPLVFLRRSGFAGKVFPINPRRQTVLGEPAWSSIDALPSIPDHAFILTPTENVAGAVKDCVKCGVPIVTILAGGFAEEGEQGREREAELKKLLVGSRTRLVGPNSIGVVNIHTGLTLTANAAFAETNVPRGGLFVASHSGSMIGAMLSRGKARGVGFAGFISTGSELDLSLGDLCAATLNDPTIDVYALFLETIRGGASLRRFALEAARRGKPVLAYKLGRSEQAAELSQSHTGAIAGEDGVADAFLKDCGIVRVDTLESLLECPALLRRIGAFSLKRKPQVALVTTTGGGAAMIVDQLGIRGIDAVPPSVATMDRLKERGVFAPRGRIVDLTLAGTRPEIMKASIETLLEAPEFDLVIAVAGSSARFQPELLIPAIIDAAAHTEKPFAAFVAPEAPEALLEMTNAGIACFRTPESCADSIAAAFARRSPKPFMEIPYTEGGRQLNEVEGYTVLSAIGIPIAPYAEVEPGIAASPVGYPAAVKMLSAEVLHKSELGGVILDVKNDVEFRNAVTQITKAVGIQSQKIRIEKLLVQKMTQGLGEVLVSFRRDPDAGPVIMLAAGGVLAELHKDRSLRLAPVTFDEAQAMINEVKALSALTGYRGRPKGDLDALAKIVVTLSEAGKDVMEAEINPLIVRAEGQGAVAVDAVVRLKEIE